MSPYGHQPPSPPPSPQMPPPPSPTPPYPHYDPPLSSPPYVPVSPPSLPPYVPVPPPSYPPYLSPPSYPPAPTPTYYDSPLPPTPNGPVPTPYDNPAPPPSGSNSTGYTPPPPGHGHGGHILIVVLVPIAGLCLLGLLAGLLLFARRRRRIPEEPECPPEEVQEVSEYVRVQEQVVCGPAGEVDVLDDVIVQQEHGVVSHAHGRGEGLC